MLAKKSFLLLRVRVYEKNQARYILANDLTEIKEEQHHAYLLDESHVYEANTKKAIANLIFERVTNHD